MGRVPDLEALLAVQGPRTLENSLVLYDQILVHLDAAGCEPGLLERVHPEALVRAAAEEATREVDKFATALSLNRGVYESLKAIDVSGCDGATQYFLARTLRDYRRAGVDRDEATRKRVQGATRRTDAHRSRFRAQHPIGHEIETEGK